MIQIKVKDAEVTRSFRQRCDAQEFWSRCIKSGTNADWLENGHKVIEHRGNQGFKGRRTEVSLESRKDGCQVRHTDPMDRVVAHLGSAE